MKKITQNLRWLVTLLTMIVSVGAWAEEPTGTITFGTNATKINSASVTGEDSQGNEWTITTEGTTSYTANADYYQVGSSKSPATSITFTTTLPSSQTITSMSAKFGGFNGTEGTVTMKVGDTTIGEGSLNGTSDVTVKSTSEAAGTVLTVTVTDIEKGVKCYNISYTYNGGGTPTPTVPSISVDPATVNATAEETEGTIEVTYENIDPELAEIHFYEADGETAATYDWIVAEFDSDNNIEYIISANEGEARTAYLKVYGLDAETNDVYSDLITINQAAYVAPPTPVTGAVYTKVTSTSDITDGQYLIVYEEGSVAFNGGLATLDAAGNTIGVVLNNGTIEGSEETEAAEFTINVTEGSLKSASGYYVGVTGNSNGLKTSESSETYTNSFAIDDNGDAIISAVFEGSTMTLRFNKASDQNRFRYYKNGGQQPIQLYKKVVEEETSPTVTIGASKWATYVAEDNVTFPSEVSAFTVETIKTDHVTLGEVLAVKKGTPILVYSETPGTYTLEVVAEDVCNDASNNKLKVSDGTVTGGSTIYVLAQPQNSEIGFYPLASNVTVPAGKAYLEIIESKAPVKGFFALGELADAINNIAVENANGTIFNIAGQKVQNITKGGLYIVNGKKVVVK